MSTKYIRPSYLVLLGVATSSFLVYTFFMSPNWLARGVPVPRFAGGPLFHRPQDREVSNVSALLAPSNRTFEAPTDDSVDSLAAPREPSSSAKKNTTAPSLIVANASVSIEEAMRKGIAAFTIYEAGHENVNTAICPDMGNLLDLVIIITSAPNHEEARMAIRQTWGHYKNRKDVSIAFMLGSSPDTSINAAIIAEDSLYGDVIRGKFKDAYDNLTLKTMSMLEWVDNYCNRARFVLKTDDDMFINVPRLLEFARKKDPKQRSIYGRLARKWKPIRNKKSKYYISPKQYKPGLFPDFTTGPAYLIAGTAVHSLYAASLNQTYFKLEDVFMTGIVAQSVGVKRIHAAEFLNRRITFNGCNIKKGISIHMIKASEQFELWKKLYDGKTKCN